MAERKRLYLQGAALASVLVVSAITTDAEDWRPLSLVVAMCALMVLAESVAVETRKIRTSAGMLVQVPIMAILGPGPAVFAGVLAVAVDARVNRVRGEELLLNFLIFSGVGLVGGLAFDGLREALDLDRGDSANALLVLPVYTMLCLLNVAFIVLFLPGRTPAERRRVVRESGVPLIPLELVSAVLASAAVLAWADAGLWAIVGLLVVLLVIIALARTVSSNLRLSDDSDARSAEVARLSSDRERLLSEVLDAEQRERARLAESLHDGPMQRLAAIRQDAAESDSALASHLDVALAETRAIISAFHPATTAQMGLEASLRAAVAPFPASAGITLTVSGTLHDPLPAAAGAGTRGQRGQARRADAHRRAGHQRRRRDRAGGQRRRDRDRRVPPSPGRPGGSPRAGDGPAARRGRGRDAGHRDPRRRRNPLAGDSAGQKRPSRRKDDPPNGVVSCANGPG